MVHISHILLSTAFSAPCPTAIMIITELTQIIIPSILRVDLSLLDHIFSSASKIFSRKFINN